MGRVVAFRVVFEPHEILPLEPAGDVVPGADPTHPVAFVAFMLPAAKNVNQASRCAAYFIRLAQSAQKLLIWRTRSGCVADRS